VAFVPEDKRFDQTLTEPHGSTSGSTSHHQHRLDHEEGPLVKFLMSESVWVSAGFAFQPPEANVCGHVETCEPMRTEEIRSRLVFLFGVL
jgi:hypothetical protein